MNASPFFKGHEFVSSKGPLNFLLVSNFPPVLDPKLVTFLWADDWQIKYTVLTLGLSLRDLL